MLMMDKDIGCLCGFGFVMFEFEVGVEVCFFVNFEIYGKFIEVKKV